MFEVHWSGDGISRFDNMLKGLGGPKMRLALTRALKHTGRKGRTQVKRQLAGQTGLSSRVIGKALKELPPNFGRMAYVLKTEGGNISLKYFKPRETRKGVSAAPFGKRRVFDGSFMRGGRFPNRVGVARFGGHVFERVGSARSPIQKVKSDVFIPNEMVTGQTLDAWTRLTGAELPKRIEHEVGRLLE